MSIAIFDLDNTLISNDSDYLWGEYLVTNNLVDSRWFAAENKRFLDEYNSGNLQIKDWLDFQFKPLIDNNIDDLYKWRNDYVQTIIKPIVLSKGLEKVRYHQNNGDEVLIISATNYFITRPIANLFGIKTLLATKPEIKNNRYTGNIEGVITFQSGKIVALQDFLKQKNLKCETCYFYSDSHNDLPLLEKVSNPIAVDPDDKLRTIANNKNWEIISFRDK